MVKGATIDSMMIKKELKMVREFGMFSDEGNQAVADVVEFATKLSMDWPGVYGLLQQLSKQEQFGEATDTVVREYVYDAMGFTSEFYV
jgi:hypothetical protein